ncbi:MAG: hypothetical protein GF355_12865 [Candidatus Eisenbacteria bacterium]|nr:hypothetical protein [Candidatus Eisenbacteria bacterium]
MNQQMNPQKLQELNDALCRTIDALQSFYSSQGATPNSQFTGFPQSPYNPSQGCTPGTPTPAGWQGGYPGYGYPWGGTYPQWGGSYGSYPWGGFYPWYPGGGTPAHSSGPAMNGWSWPPYNYQGYAGPSPQLANVPGFAYAQNSPFGWYNPPQQSSYGWCGYPQQSSYSWCSYPQYGAYGYPYQPAGWNGGGFGWWHPVSQHSMPWTGFTPFTGSFGGWNRPQQSGCGPTGESYAAAA